MKEISVCESVVAHPHVNVLGVDVSAINMDGAIDLAERWIATGQSGYICMSGVHGVTEAQSNTQLRHILNNSVINAPDGMPMSWIGWLRGHTQMDRVYGPDFMTNLCKLSSSRGYRHYLYGGHPSVAQVLKHSLEERFPGLQIVGIYSPPFRPLNPEEEDAFLNDVWHAKPDILWVGLSTPKQECFMGEYAKRLGVPLLVGVGAAFDFHVGRIHDAPGWIKRAGFQWLHRLVQDPRRLWKRYLFNNPVFLWRIALQLLKLRSYGPAVTRAPKAASSTTNS